MSTVRRGRMASDDFAHVSNQFARDSRLSLKARGLGLWLFSHEDGWNLSIRSIAKQVGCGVEAVQSGLRELEDHGYLTRQQSNEAGRFGDMDYVVTDIPAGETAYGKPVHGGDHPDADEPVNGSTVNRVSDTHKKTKFQEHQGEEHQGDISSDALFDLPGQDKPAEDETVGIPPDAPTFEDFWKAYPLKKAKLAAERAWKKALFQVSLDGRGNRAQLIVDGAERYAKERADEPAKFTRYPATWLNGGCWEDEPVKPSGYRPYRDEDYYPDAEPWFKPEDLED